MHSVFADRILEISGPAEIFQFRMPLTYEFGGIFDMGKFLTEHHNPELLRTKIPKQYSEVYPESLELACFESLLDNALATGIPLHLENISQKAIADRIKNLYIELGYFVPELNAFVVDFEHAPVTLGVNLASLIYSTKDIYLLDEQLFSLVPPPRSPTHQKALIAAVNSGIISRIRVDQPQE